MERTKTYAMRHITQFFLGLSLLLFCRCKEPPSDLEQLQFELKRQISEIDGEVAVAFYDLATTETLLINAESEYHAASTMKVPVMIELFAQADEGRISLKDSILLQNRFKSIVDGSPYSMDVNEDSDDVVYDRLGTKMTLYDLICPMITVSSNLATNILIQEVGAKKVTARMRKLGATNMEVLRGVEDQKAYDRGLNNTTTAKDLMKVMKAIAEHNAVSADASREMVKILKEQFFNDMIPLYLPKDVEVAHKTGFITGVHHDAAIIYLPNGHAYVLVLLSKNLGDFEMGTQQLARLSKKVYDHAVKKSEP
ncbi:MAG: serine hydrolase [Sediminicola sp.]